MKVIGAHFSILTHPNPQSCRKLEVLKQKLASVNYAKTNLHKTTRVAIYQMEDIIGVSSVGTLGSLGQQGTGVDFKAATGSLYMIHQC